MLLDSKRQEIIACHNRLVSEEKLPNKQTLEKQYSTFREHFGPKVLESLDGEPLLNLMHDLSNRNSLVYWLEFKSDNEFDTKSFGSIAGGSSLKYRIFKRRETGNWQAAGVTGNQPKDISLQEAIEIARSHRDQLLKSVELLKSLPDNATDEQYAQLQDQLSIAAPDLSRLSFAHKYLSLLFPDKLDDYHIPELQRFHLLKLLQLPPEGDGRYSCAGRFVEVAKESDLSMNHLTTTLNTIHGRQHRYWRIGTRSASTKNSLWPMMRERSRVAIGWSKLGDISWLESKSESREKLKALLQEIYPTHHTAIGRDCSQLFQFVLEMTEGDIIIAADGMKILGVGRVVGEYEFNSTYEFSHQRKVEWITTDQWQMPQSNEGLQSTVRELGKYNVNLLAIEKLIQSRAVINPKRRLTGIPGRIQSILERKGQVLLYGPPGTGKTYWAERTAKDLAAIKAFDKLFTELDEAQKHIILGFGDNPGLVQLCCFHPGYGYEDFLEGFRPKTVNGQVSFELRDGIFKRLCKAAAASPERNFYLIVDEINRGDIPRIFGELLTTIEKDKRGKQIVLPLSQDTFSVPPNVFLMGTMNTADRSISLLDAALRRRFGFVELMPDGAVLKDSAVAGIALKAWLDAINTKIRANVGRDARNLQIGHSFLMHGDIPIKDMATLKRAIRDDIIPLLEEYCYEEYKTLGNILGEQIVDVAKARIRHELFDDGQEAALVQGLLAPFPEIATSSEALATDDSQAESNNDEEGSDS